MKSSNIGGQAVLEGVMMKNGDQYAVAVRKPDGEIALQKEVYDGIVKWKKLTKIPFVRGIFSFVDSLVLGMKTLSYSASFFEEEEEEEEEEDDAIKVAVIGKPNAGKSSLVNKILGEERVIVSNVAGTTRDAIDSRFENDKGKFVFIDTAGMRKKSKVEEDIEKYSVLRATLAIERSDVCLILIDATEGVTEQDTKVAGLAHEAGKASIIVVNKWDLIEKDGKTMDKMREEVRNGLAFMTYAPILFISAKTGQRVDRLFELIDYVSNQASTRITTGMLNSVLADAQTRVQPPSDKGRRLKIYYMTQVGIRPPHFVVFCNDSRLFHFSYQRYLENCLRNTFGLEGTPITLSIRQRGEKEG